MFKEDTGPQIGRAREGTSEVTFKRNPKAILWWEGSSGWCLQVEL